MKDKTFKSVLEDAGIARIGFPTADSLMYDVYGAKIRSLLYSEAITGIEQMGYDQVILSDLISPNTLSSIDKVENISSGYLRLKDYDMLMAAGHEVNAYLYVEELLRTHERNQDLLPIRFYHSGPVFRKSKNTPFPFNLGERKSFLECYAMFPSEDEASAEFIKATEWNRRTIFELLHIPGVEVVRPTITNKKISKRTVCIDSLTPLGRTTITGMTYFHDDIFTSAINIKVKNKQSGRKSLVHAVHFGISEHIFFSYLLNSYQDGCIRLLSRIAPFQIDFIYCEKTVFVPIVEDLLRETGYRFRTELVPRNKIKNRLKKNNIQGVPVTILTKKQGEFEYLYAIYRNNQDAIAKIKCGDGMSLEQRVQAGHILDTLLRQNDDDIISYMQERQEREIVDCDKLQDLDDIVKSGKIAKIFLENTNENVLELETHLSCGEILGFQSVDNAGKDLLSKQNTKFVAYASRRT